MSQERSDLIESVLQIAESENFECKRADTEPSKLLKATTALANTTGGLD